MKDTYIFAVKIENQWIIVATNKSLEKLKKHTENEMLAKIEDHKIFKLSGKEGTIGRYFDN